jgi:hypothetical protein
MADVVRRGRRFRFEPILAPVSSHHHPAGGSPRGDAEREASRRTMSRGTGVCAVGLDQIQVGGVGGESISNPIWTAYGGSVTSDRSLASCCTRSSCLNEAAGGNNLHSGDRITHARHEPASAGALADPSSQRGYRDQHKQTIHDDLGKGLSSSYSHSAPLRPAPQPAWPTGYMTCDD